MQCNRTGTCHIPNRLKPPPAEPIQGGEHLGPMPYVVIEDEVFSLQQHVMRPYPGRKSTPDQVAYNYQHLKARRIVECISGILTDHTLPCFLHKNSHEPSQCLQGRAGSRRTTEHAANRHHAWRKSGGLTRLIPVTMYFRGLQRYVWSLSRVGDRYSLHSKY